MTSRSTCCESVGGARTTDRWRTPRKRAAILDKRQPPLHDQTVYEPIRARAIIAGAAGIRRVGGVPGTGPIRDIAIAGA